MTTSIKITNRGPHKVRVVAKEMRGDGSLLSTPMIDLDPNEVWEGHVWAERSYVVRELPIEREKPEPMQTERDP